MFTLAGAIPPRRIPWVYRVTLGLTALVMVLLPLLYVALTVAVGYGVWIYAHVGTALFTGGSGGMLWRLIAYIGPLFAGATLVAFMVKPLFARPSREAAACVLDLDQQPELRAMIESICLRVGAPVPVRVDLDCQVNASARLRRGLLSLGRNDLVLTIGLPLVAGLSARQFAGVLAHEFGHFAQGAGMAFTYIIRTVNAWFARVVFERDEWDEKLAEGSQLDFRIGVVFWLARGGVWVSRKILHGLMLVGHAIACLQLRQMEFDADYYETHVGGSESFAETSREIRRLGAASQSAFGELGELWNERRLVDNFPAFVALRRSQLAPDLIAKIDGAPLAEKTRWFDTHPSDLARAIHARALGLQGIFRGEGPATALFDHFETVSREVTEHFYREQLELQFKAEALVPTTTAARTGAEAEAADAARARLVGSVLNLARPLAWTAQELERAVDAPLALDVVHAQLGALRAELAARREIAEGIDQTFNTLHQELENAAHARVFVLAGITIKPESFGLSVADPEAIRRRETELAARLADKARELQPFESNVRRWFQTVIRSAQEPALANVIPADLRERIQASRQALVTFAPWFEALPGWLREQALLANFAANEQALGGEHRFAERVILQRSIARGIVEQAPGMVPAGTIWPFVTSAEPMTAGEKLARALEGVHGDGRIIVVLRTIVGLYFRLMGHVIAQGEELERALAAARPEGATAAATA